MNELLWIFGAFLIGQISIAILLLLCLGKLSKAVHRISSVTWSLMEQVDLIEKKR